MTENNVLSVMTSTKLPVLIKKTVKNAH